MQTGMATNFCIVDDDRDFVEFLAQYLEARGWRATGFLSGEALLQSGQVESFDFFIIDLGLPALDGIDLITLLRARSDAGILVVSGRMGPDAFNSALAAGADMFINKPVRFDQIYHAITSVSRRITPTRGAASSWLLNDTGDVLTSPGGNDIPLSGLESRLIARLMDAGGEPVSREALAEASGVGGAPDYRNLDAAIFRLRRKIERDGQCASPFRTAHGKGYSLAEVILQEGRQEG